LNSDCCLILQEFDAAETGHQFDHRGAAHLQLSYIGKIVITGTCRANNNKFNSWFSEG
jgi:hypothetical protein